MTRYLDELFIFIGCVLILIGVYIAMPVLTWFTAGLMFIMAGVVIGVGRKAK